MQLTPDQSDIDSAVAELKLTLPVCAMTNIVARRRQQHKDVKQHRRILALWRARQIMAECNVD